MKKELVILTGPSGSGVSSAKFVFEELGYYIVENLPSSAIDSLLSSFEKDKFFTEKFALMVSIDAAKEILEKARKNSEFNTTFVVLTTDKNELLKRYALTRHTHPRAIAYKVSLEEGVDIDIKLTTELIQDADLSVDTTGLTVKDLRKGLMSFFTISKEKDVLTVNFISFGMKNGAPAGLDMLFDVRTIPNPYWVEELKSLTGYDQKVVDYMMSFDETHQLLDNITQFLDKHLAQIKESGRHSYNIGIGCSGGQHRSTFVAKYLRDYFSNQYLTHTIHRDSPELNGK